MNVERKIWEFEGFTTCRVLGLTFDSIEMKNIFKELKIDGHQYLTESEMHGALVRACAERNPISEYIDKTLKERFERYKRRLKGLDQEDISLLIERGDISKDVPLAALIWFAARNQDEKIREIEGRVFNAVHIREHRALRFYDDLCRELPLDGTDKEVISELRSGLELNEKLKRNLDRSKQKIDQFKSEIDAIRADKSELSIELKEEKRLNEKLRRRWENSGGEEALEQIENLKREVKFLTGEIDVLNEELIGRIAKKPILGIGCWRDYIEERPMIDDTDGGSSLEGSSLEGKNIALVGGVESLVPCYKETVESFGGVFYHHCGICSMNRREMEELVEKVDAVFCPVDMNSHNACRYAKKACKFRNKPCYFLKSSGLTAFRKRLIDFAGHQNRKIVADVLG
jgi:Uncharacterized protein conserved in bacteria (DUF2325).